jgi:hypothetical protein
MNMGLYFSEEALAHHKSHDTGRSLEAILRHFPVKAKKALYVVATSRDRIAAGRWSGSRGPGCGLNEAGKVMGGKVTSVAQAVLVLGVDATMARRFIVKWDSMRTSESRRPFILQQALATVGVTVPPIDYQDDEGTVVFNMHVHKGTATEFAELLDKVDTIEDMGFTRDELDAIEFITGDLELV